MNRGSIVESEIFDSRTVEHAMEENPFAKVGEIVHRTIEEAILTSILPAGTKLNISKISEALNVSPTPVRNAIDRLVEDNLIIPVSDADAQYKSYIVFDLSGKELEDLFIARKSIEGMAAYICAEKFWTLDLNKLRALAYRFYDGMKSYAGIDVANRPLPRESNADKEFHEMIVNAPGNEYLSTAYSAIKKKIQYLSIRTVALNANEPEDVLIRMGAQHISIFNAINDGYPETARRLMEQHIDYCMQCCLRNHDRIRL